MPGTLVPDLDNFTTEPGGPVGLSELSAHVLGETAGRVSDGAGIDVAVIDTGVASVDGLVAGSNVIHGPDISVDGDGVDRAHTDAYGHGTHMAGIIAGNRVGHEGIAPGARIVSVKVSGADGHTSIPRIVAAIDWVVTHRDADGMNIRVLHLAFGATHTDTHLGDPLSAALERAWHADIVVVVAAGNHGDTDGRLCSPAIDPYVISVAGTDSTNDRNAPGEWSSRGDGVRNPDLAAPGRSIASYRVPGSTIDRESPEGRVDGDLFRGTGTSQAAAVVSGVVARVLGQFPELTPDDVKATLRLAARDSTLDTGADERAVGQGVLSAPRAFASPVRSAAAQEHAPAIAAHAPEFDWNGGSWTGGSWTGGSWTGGSWTGGSWTGGSWTGGSWTGGSWTGGSWT